MRPHLLAPTATGVVIPALPEKRVATKLVSLGPEFLAQRCAGLDAFLKRCAAHHTLRLSPALVVFLEASDESWAAYTQRPVEGLTLAKQPVDAAARLRQVTTAAGALITGHPNEQDAQYEVLRSYYSELEQFLQECTATSETLVRRQLKLASSLHEFGSAVRDLGTAAGCEEPAGSTLGNLATCCLALAAQGQVRAQLLTQALEAPMRDLVRSMSGVKGALASRAGAHGTHRQLVADLEAKRTRIAKTRESGRGDATRLDADEREAAATSLRVEQAAAEYEAVCRRMEGELQAADAQRAAALGAIGRALGAAQRDMARDQAQAFTLMGVDPAPSEAVAVAGRPGGETP